MGKNIVICSDGTGNTFNTSVSNVTRLIKLLALDNRREQIVVYDQGIGTNSKRLKAIEDYRKSIPEETSLEILDGPQEWWFDPTGLPTRLLGLAVGYGFKANVREMYQKLSQLYEGPDDKIYLFGFSRGAFTVRALAGLLYRCGLPGKNVENFEDYFDEAYRLYTPIEKDCKEITAFRDKHSHMLRDCKIHFLGIWDTVKSYGGIYPIILPHLRHNPCVNIVRHALALNERRSWFNATTWGRLNLDDCGAAKRLTKTELDELKKQIIEEVWFRGCHSDIGGGDAEANTAKIALRWMLGEAAAAGVRLNSDGKMILKDDDAPGPVEIHGSLFGLWWVSEYLPRWEIDNSGKYPVRKFKWSRTGLRNPDNLTRNEKILLHTSVGNLHSISVPVEHRPTKLLR